MKLHESTIAQSNGMGMPSARTSPRMGDRVKKIRLADVKGQKRLILKK
jgi:hypothetical protein